MIYFRLHSQSFVIVCKSSSSVHLHPRGHQQDDQQYQHRPSSPRRYQPSPSYHLSLILSSSSILDFDVRLLHLVPHLIIIINAASSIITMSPSYCHSLHISNFHHLDVQRNHYHHPPVSPPSYAKFIVIVVSLSVHAVPACFISFRYPSYLISSLSMSMKHTRLKLPYAARRHCHCHSLSSVFIILILDVCLEE